VGVFFDLERGSGEAQAADDKGLETAWGRGYKGDALLEEVVVAAELVERVNLAPIGAGIDGFERIVAGFDGFEANIGGREIELFGGDREIVPLD